MIPPQVSSPSLRAPVQMKVDKCSSTRRISNHCLKKKKKKLHNKKHVTCIKQTRFTKKKKKSCNFLHFMTRSLILCNGANVQDPIVLLKYIIKFIVIKPELEVDSVYELGHRVTSSTSELTVKP